MWQICFGFWTHTALTTQSMYTNWILSILPLVTPYSLASSSRHHLLESSNVAFRCPACDGHMALTTRQQPSRASNRWLSCSRCGVSRLLANLPEVGDGSKFPIITGSQSHRGIPNQR